MVLLHWGMGMMTGSGSGEADEMCTRLSIMVNGSLQCIGTSQHIKHKFGDAYQVGSRTISVFT